MAERLVVWHRWLPPKRDAADALAAVAEWRRTVEGRFQVFGATLLGSMGASVAASFDPADLPEVAELALDLLDEAEAAGLEIALGLALGEVTAVDDARVGAPIERAELLATRARGGEVVLDPAARDGLAETMLFGRQVAAGAGMPRGTTLDRAHPRRLECAEAIAKLGATALPPVIASIRTRVEEALSGGACRTFVLRGPVGAGTTELIADLERRVEPSRVWRFGAAPGGVVPLASFRLALLRRFGSPEKVRQAFDHGGATGGAATAMARVASGELVPVDALAAAIETLLVLESEGGARPWVVLSPLGLVDGATLAALLEARARGGDFVIFGRLPVETPPPRPLAELDEPVQELTLPPLKVADARVVAEAVLGPDTSDDVARRVAVLGGDTVLGVVEAARTLVATGDLVHDGDAFVWRTGPRSGAGAIGTDALLSERLELLDGPARRVLEALCVVPDGSSRALLTAVAEQDGVRGERVEKSLDLLMAEALARGRERPRPASSLLRWRVLSLIPPARSMELHRFVGEALRRGLAAGEAREDLPRRVELGHFLVEGGVEPEGRGLVMDALEPLVESGYERAARQLSGWLHAVAEREAGEVGRATPAPPPPEAHEEPPPSAELALDELLDELAEEEAAEVPPPPPPPSRPLGARAAPDEDEAASTPTAAGAPAPAPAELDAELDALIEPPDDFDDATAPVGPATEAPAAPSSVPAPPSASAAPAEAAPALDDAVDALLGAPWPDPGTATLTPVEALEALEALEPERTSVAPAPMRPFVEAVVRALRDRDFEELERAIQRAIAEGSDLGAVGRLRAVAELARGDLSAARRSLASARRRGRDDASAQARYHLAEALLELSSGEPLSGIRAGLAALAASRRLTDARGEAAALHALAACYRALGRDELANGLRPPH